MANFTIDGRLKGAGDIIRQFNYEMLIPNVGDLKQDDMIVRIKSCVIPGRSMEIITTHFMGSTAYFPGKVTFTGTVQINVEDHEDMKALQQFYSWQQMAYDVDPNGLTAGSAKVRDKRALSRNISLYMYSFDGRKLPNKIVLYNSFVESQADSALGYANSDSVKYDFGIRYDYWKLERA